ncbi:hypothetical protein [Erythrobacter sp.]|uniref:hypothetical protein n=1 Tax=Erythrobacter sp. TaxID=1042 RepID=UPI001425F6EF|nr:hypothetical protein [Erythrobacter sp.]QIQ87830.1 MAG: hypothetical protein G9473_14900 [Erythrobacter sp.]
MPITPPLRALLAAALPALALGACTSTYTGPVEVTRFVAQQRAAELGEGGIAIVFPEEMSNKTARAAFESAVAAELKQLGYTIATQPGTAGQTATIRTSREPIASAGGRRSPVNVGVGGQTGTFGSGVGVGVGINLGGGGNSGPRVVTQLAVRILGPAGESLWEGRANLETSMNSPYSETGAAARTLAAALFREFPGGNGETVTIDVADLEGTE